MCQLIGLSSNKKVDIKLSLKEFRHRGRNNPHGWGLAFYENEKNNWKILKRASSLTKENIEEEKFNFKSKIIIGHVRLASCGGISHENTHPFSKENWVFAHNGTVSRIKSMQEFSLKYFTPEGETDSEYAFLYLLEKVKNLNELNSIFNLLENESKKIKAHGRFNFLMSNGKVLFAFGDDSLYFVSRKAPFDKIKLRNEDLDVDLNEIKDPDEQVVLIATEPLTENEEWERIIGLRVFKDGKEIVF